MIRRARIVGLALLALTVPQIAFGGEEPSTAPATLSVSASLDGCGLAESAIVCEIGANWSSLEGAEHYTVSVTRPDGSVIDAGQVAGTSRSLFVPYVGAGTYSVQVAAWGTPPGEDEPKVMAREKAMSTDGGHEAVSGLEASRGDEDETRSDDGIEPATGNETDPGEVEPPAEEEPDCDEADEDPRDNEDDEDQDPAAEAATAQQGLAAPTDPVADDPDDTPPVCP